MALAHRTPHPPTSRTAGARRPETAGSHTVSAMTAPPAKRRRLSPEARRQQILDTAMLLTPERPLKDLTVEAVADRAGVSKSLIFHYFPTLRDLQLEVLRIGAEALVSIIDRARGDGPPEEQLANGLEAYLDFMATRSETIAWAASLATVDPDFEAVYATVRTQATDLARQCFEGRTDALGDYVLGGWITFVDSVSHAWIRDPAGIERSDFLARLLEATHKLIEVAHQPE